MSDMFAECSKLESLDASNFNTSQITDMRAMFYNCISLTCLDVSNFNTSKVVRMDGLFYGCTQLTRLDLSSFDTEKVISMYLLFGECTSLTQLDLSSFDTSQLISMLGMFKGLSLERILLGEKFHFVGTDSDFMNITDRNTGEKIVYWKKVNANEWYTPEQLVEGYSTKGVPTGEYIPVQIQEEAFTEDTAEPIDSSSESTATSDPAMSSTEPTSSTSENNFFTSSSQNKGEEQLAVTNTSSSSEPTATSDDPKETKLATLGAQASPVLYQLLGGLLLLVSLVVLFRVNKKRNN